MIALDLDEVDELDQKYWWFSQRRWSPLQLRCRDYLTGASTKKNHYDEKEAFNDDKVSHSKNLKSTALSIAATLGADCKSVNRVVMLAQLRCFGLYFSPVNFFFLQCDDDAVYLLAEVSNTPWNKKHCYLIDLKNIAPTPKDFHVSPFMNMDMEYRWKIEEPKKNTRIEIDSWREQCLFKAVFTADRHEISPSNVRKVLLNWPVVTLGILQRIYWQALKLYVKGIPYVPYMKTSNSVSSFSSSNNTTQGDKHENL
ncbi:MAG: DUF1365 family protein [Pseudohongiellaceae bacterium]|jgi:DUF1365 family protein